MFINDIEVKRGNRIFEKIGYGSYWERDCIKSLEKSFKSYGITTPVVVSSKFRGGELKPDIISYSGDKVGFDCMDRVYRDYVNDVSAAYYLDESEFEALFDWEQNEVYEDTEEDGRIAYWASTIIYYNGYWYIPTMDVICRDLYKLVNFDGEVVREAE